MKARTIGYWITTVLVAASYALGGVLDLMQPEDVVKGLAHVGYPLHFATLLGVWKLLGVVAILAPKLPRLKEWAYAGMFFNLTAAAYTHVRVGDGIAEIANPTIICILLVASWALRPDSRKLPGPAL